MANEIVTLEKAISAIKTAADEIPTEDFISYSTILDVHLQHIYEEFSPDDQAAFLEALRSVLIAHGELFRDIAWDLVSVLLPFVGSPDERTSEVAHSILSDAAKQGNPREVFIKLLEALSNIPWTQIEDDEEEDSDQECHSGGEEPSETPKVPERNPEKLRKDATQGALKKYSVLITALHTVHSRIETTFPSRFLSTELTTLLGTFAHAVEALDRNETNNVLGSLLDYVELVSPKLPQAEPPKVGKRPPLPPRRSSHDLLKLSEVPADSPEVQLQARLLLSFLSHLLEAYLLRTRRGSTITPPEPAPRHSVIELGDTDGRSLELGWAGKYDEEVVRKGRSKVPGGHTLIDEERAEREAQTGVKEMVERIGKLAGKFGVKTEELIAICESIEEVPHDVEEEAAYQAAPKVAADVPLAKVGSLFLLCHLLSSSTSSAILRIFPEHDQIAQNFMIYGQGQSQPPVLDALLFLGALAQQTGKLGEVPDEVDPFLIYLQIFAVASAAAASPQSRFLAHRHVAQCIRAHPNEMFKLMYFRDTLEYCPFESLKAAVIGILKDEIMHATQPPPSTDGVGEDEKPQPSSEIFGSPIVLAELEDDLFPDMREILGAKEGEKAWDMFRELYPRLVATANLYYFLLLSEAAREHLAVAEKKRLDTVEERWLGPLRSATERFKDKQGDGLSEVAIVADVVGRIGEVRKKLSE